MSSNRGVIPKLVWNWLVNYEAWVVGSGVDWILGGQKGDKPRDLDILIPHQHYNDACKWVSGQVKKQPEFNSFGGLKIQTEGFEIDFWPDHIERFTAFLTKSEGKALRLFPYTLLRIEKRP